jgi:hypothetical protein
MTTVPTCFINSGYGLLDLTRLAAIELAVFDSQYEPTLDSDGEPLGEQPRSTTILNALARCDRSVHDLSLSRGTGPYRHARSNMVYEAAMAVAHAKHKTAHRVLVCFPLGYRVERSLFDLFGERPPTQSGLHPPGVDAQPQLCAYQDLTELYRLVVFWLTQQTPTSDETRVFAYRDALTERARPRPPTHRQHARFQIGATERRDAHRELGRQ